MALQIKYKPANDDEIPNAYARIGSVSFCTRNGAQKFSVSFDVFRNKAASDAGRPPLGGMDFNFTDTPEKRVEKERTLEDGTKEKYDEVTPAVTDFSDAWKLLQNEGDKRALAYEFVLERRSGKQGSEFKDAVSV